MSKITNKLALGLLVTSVTLGVSGSTQASQSLWASITNAQPGCANLKVTHEDAKVLQSGDNPKALDLTKPNVSTDLAALAHVARDTKDLALDAEAKHSLSLNLESAVANGYRGVAATEDLTPEIRQEVMLARAIHNDGIRNADAIDTVQRILADVNYTGNDRFKDSLKYQVLIAKAAHASKAAGNGLAFNDIAPVADLNILGCAVTPETLNALHEFKNDHYTHVEIANPTAVDILTMAALELNGENDPDADDFEVVKTVIGELQSDNETNKMPISGEIAAVALRLRNAAGEKIFADIVMGAYYWEYVLNLGQINDLTDANQVNSLKLLEAAEEILKNLGLDRKTGNPLTAVTRQEVDATLEILENKVHLLGSDRAITDQDIKTVGLFRRDEGFAHPSSIVGNAVTLYTDSIRDGDEIDAWVNAVQPTVVELKGLSRLINANVDKESITPEITGFVGNLTALQATLGNVKGVFALMNDQLGQNALVAPSLNQVRAAGLAVAAPDNGLVEAVAAVMQREETANPGANYVPRFSAKILNLDDGHGNAVVEITQLTNNLFAATPARISALNVAHIDSAALIAGVAGIKVNDYIFGNDVVDHAANQVELTNLISLIK